MLMQQSPVDITGYALHGAPKMEFHYGGAADYISNTCDFIRVKYGNGGGILIDARDEYPLTELHLHNPGEHTVDGERFALEAHLVHKRQSDDIAVVAISYRLGEENAAIQGIIDSTPGQGKSDNALLSSLAASCFLPTNGGYYTYIGSLTTAPYTEGVQWFVLSEVLEVSEEQVRALAAATGGRTNNRAIQPLNGRLIRMCKGSNAQNENLARIRNQTGS